jgi:hypothetical protein
LAPDIAVLETVIDLRNFVLRAPNNTANNPQYTPGKNLVTKASELNKIAIRILKGKPRQATAKAEIIMSK